MIIHCNNLYQISVLPDLSFINTFGKYLCITVKRFLNYKKNPTMNWINIRETLKLTILQHLYLVNCFVSFRFSFLLSIFMECLFNIYYVHLSLIFDLGRNEFHLQEVEWNNNNKKLKNIELISPCYG